MKVKFIDQNTNVAYFFVKVNNTHNVSYGGSNNVNNVAYSKYTTANSSIAPTTSSSTKEANVAKTYPRRKDQDVVVLLPHRKNRAPRLKHKLSVSSNVFKCTLLSREERRRKVHETYGT